MESQSEHKAVLSQPDEGRVEVLQPPSTAVTGSASDQAAATPEATRALVKVNIGELAELPNTQALYELNEVGRSTMVLLRPNVELVERENRRLTAELNRLRDANSELVRDNAVLKAQLAGERRQKVLQNFLITAGGLINSGAVKLFFDRQTAVAYLLLAVGFGLMLGGWLWPKGGGDLK